MGYKYGYKSPNMGCNFCYLNYNPRYLPRNLQVGFRGLEFAGLSLASMQVSTLPIGP